MKISHKHSSQRYSTLILIFVMLSSIYLLTYSGAIESGDTRIFFDATSSFFDHGDTLVDLALSVRAPVRFDPQNPYPLQNADIEILQVLAATPLYFFARTFSFGLVHTVWLLNIFVAAASACLIYLYAEKLGYKARTGIFAAVIFGVGTLIFPYTRTFFREPLALFMLLLAGYALEHWRGSQFRGKQWMVLALLFVVGMFLAKASMLLALPALIFLALPAFKIRLTGRRVLISVIVLAVLAFVAAFALVALDEVGGRYNILGRLRGINMQYFSDALKSYLLSPGGSIWGTSPIILLGIPSVILMFRRGQVRYTSVFLLFTLGFALGYAILSDVHWFGGLSLPPRFLLPIIPFGVLLSLPALERLLDRPMSPSSLIGWVLIVYSVWVQIGSVGYDLTAYPAALPPEAHGLAEWEGGLYNPQWFRWVVLLSLWGTLPPDFAWLTLDLPLWAFAFAVIAIVCLAVMVLRPRLISWLSGGVAVVFAGAVVMGLIALADTDYRYRATDESLFAALDTIQAETTPDDVILLSSPRYESFFHNYNTLAGAAGRVIGLPLQPGEQSSPEQPVMLSAENPAALLNRYTIPLIQNLAETRDRLWLLVDGSSELAWSIRPVERYMSAYFYPVRVFVLGDFTRLIEYSTADAPNPFAFGGAEQTTDIRFGESIRLLGFEINGGNSLNGRDYLPISLYWQADAPLESRYTVAVYLRDANGAPIAQHDYPPFGGFAPTDTWQPNRPVWDHRALALPSNLPDGEYQLWVKLYDFAPDGIVRDLPVTHGNALDEVIAILPVTLTAGE